MDLQSIRTNYIWSEWGGTNDFLRVIKLKIMEKDIVGYSNRYKLPLYPISMLINSMLSCLSICLLAAPTTSPHVSPSGFILNSVMIGLNKLNKPINPVAMLFMAVLGSEGLCVLVVVIFSWS